MHGEMMEGVVLCVHFTLTWRAFFLCTCLEMEVQVAEVMFHH